MVEGVQPLKADHCPISDFGPQALVHVCFEFLRLECEILGVALCRNQLCHCYSDHFNRPLWHLMGMSEDYEDSDSDSDD